MKIIYMTQGKSRSSNTFDLSLIFFKIRETRCTKTRRSWQRRARLALAKREDLTAAERHEICAVWSRSDCIKVNSPAMSKLQGIEHAPRRDQTITALSCTRRSFNVNCSVSRIDHALDSALRHQVNCMFWSALFATLTLHFQEYICQRSHRGSVEPDFLSDSRADRRRRRAQKPERCKKRKKTKISKLLLNSFQNLSKKQQFRTHEIHCRR